MTALSSDALGKGQPTVSVVILNYMSSTHVKKCLASLATEPINEIFVLDNGSGDAEWDRLMVIAETAESNVRWARNAENTGFAAGVNEGVRRLGTDRSEFLWILNPDTIVLPGATDAMADAMSNSEFGILSPVILAGDSDKIWFVGGSVDHSRGLSKHESFGRALEVFSGIHSTAFMTGAAPMFRREVWEDLGGFREDLFLYWEDSDLSNRATKLGIAMGVVGDATIRHAEGGSSAGTGRGPAYYYYMQRNRLLVERQYSSRINLLLGRGFLVTLKLALRPLRESEQRPRKFFAGVKGVTVGAFTRQPGA
jgi:N-acetylglucosaminyl-diphospho-decaprenol L-rhamnosyltransferase